MREPGLQAAFETGLKLCALQKDLGAEAKGVDLVAAGDGLGEVENDFAFFAGADLQIAIARPQLLSAAKGYRRVLADLHRE